EDTSESKLDDIPASNISDNSDVQEVTKSQISGSSPTRYSESSIHIKPKSLEDKSVDYFLNLIHKEQISNEIIERKREKKLLRNNETSNNQDLSSDNKLPEQSNSSCVVKTVTVETEDSIVAKNNELTPSESEAHCSTIIKIPYNQKVERGLISELLEFIAEGSHEMARSNDTMVPQNSHSISGKQIFDLFKKNMAYVGDLTIETKICEETLPEMEVSTMKTKVDTSPESCQTISQ
ncbi:1398_t:CDS:2, partial [Ambispora gerdemannii]